MKLANYHQQQLQPLKKFARDLPDAEAVCFSQDLHPKQYGNINVYPWAQGIKKYFT
jgi:hypothetical protein